MQSSQKERLWVIIIITSSPQVDWICNLSNGKKERKLILGFKSPRVQILTPAVNRKEGLCPVLQPCPRKALGLWGVRSPKSRWGHMKTWSTPLIIKKNANENHNEVQPHTSEWLSSTSPQITNAGDVLKKMDPSYTAGRNVNWYNHYGNSKEVPQKTKDRTTTWSRNPTPGHISGQNFDSKR